MKVTILVFSPSGNTATIAERLQQKLEQRDVTVQMVNITGKPDIFKEWQHARFLRETVAEHDVLCVGGPVYAHHLQYHLLDLLKALPTPGNGWGSYAFPFVTYGGISSGIALEEAGDLLTQSGRTVLAGMKVTALHHFFKRVFAINHGSPGDDIAQVLDDAVKRILTVGPENSCQNHAENLKYQPREVAQKANTVFIEKEWHASHYPNVMLDANTCTQCGKCVTVCPVGHLTRNSSGSTIQDETSACIHCFNCLTACPAKAISLRVEPEKEEEGKAFVANVLKHASETPETPASAVYPVRTA